MRTITVALGISLLCVVAPTSSKAKTDHAKCEDRCRAYYCPDSVRRELYCHYQCHKMCGAENAAATAPRRTIMSSIQAPRSLAKRGV